MLRARGPTDDNPLPHAAVTTSVREGTRIGAELRGMVMNKVLLISFSILLVVGFPRRVSSHPRPGRAAAVREEQQESQAKVKTHISCSGVNLADF